jgi:alanyl-tRNA synthetase
MSQLESLKSKSARDALGDTAKREVLIDGIPFLAATVDDLDMNALREQGDRLKDKMKDGVILLLSAKDGKVNMIAMASETAIQRGVNAGNLLKAIAPYCNGGGGGKPGMAQAGGKNPAGIPKALEAAPEALRSQLA